VGDYVRRLLSGESLRSLPAVFAAVVFDESGGERPELIRYFPHGILRLLDVGCGPGEVSGAIRRTRPQVSVTGIERDPSAAALARTDLERVIEGDAREALRGLAAAGERFDAFLFADVLEHLEDPIAALALAHELALPKATLVVSVPNVGHLSLVRDLVAGRFDPLPSGLLDAGHLRWFTRNSLEEVLDEAGWHTLSIERLPGSPPPDEGEFLRWASDFPEADRDALTTYQWVAVAQPR
jgi:2-polyprenyl-3-methyl-5-hydroxy-6-metoxy-1,4-benzoquinol methylase